jgi:hypothetical protein
MKKLLTGQVRVLGDRDPLPNFDQTDLKARNESVHKVRVDTTREEIYSVLLATK